MGIFNENYLSRMNIPEIMEKIEPLFNQISRVHNMKQVKCIKNMDNISEIDSKKEDVLIVKPLKSGIIEPSIPLLNDNKKMNKNDYKFVMQPHLYRFDKNKGLEIDHYSRF